MYLSMPLNQAGISLNFKQLVFHWPLKRDTAAMEFNLSMSQTPWWNQYSFDPSLVYAKGSRLMHMLLRRWLGGWCFRKGLKAYFEKHQYGSYHRSWPLECSRWCIWPWCSSLGFLDLEQPGYQAQQWNDAKINKSNSSLGAWTKADLCHWQQLVWYSDTRNETLEIPGYAALAAANDEPLRSIRKAQLAHYRLPGEALGYDCRQHGFIWITWANGANREHTPSLGRR